MDSTKLNIKKSLERYNASPIRYLSFEMRDKYLKCAEEFSGDSNPKNNIISSLILRTQYPPRKYRYLTQVSHFGYFVNQDTETQLYLFVCKDTNSNPVNSIDIINMVKYLVEYSPVYLDILLINSSKDDIMLKINKYLSSRDDLNTFEVNKSMASLVDKKNILLFFPLKDLSKYVKELIDRGFTSQYLKDNERYAIINISDISQPFFEDQEVFRTNDLEFALETRGEYRDLFLLYQAMKLYYDTSYLLKLPERERNEWYDSAESLKEGNIVLSELILNTLKEYQTPDIISGANSLTLYEKGTKNLEWLDLKTRFAKIYIFEYSENYPEDCSGYYNSIEIDDFMENLLSTSMTFLDVFVEYTPSSRKNSPISRLGNKLENVKQITFRVHNFDIVRNKEGYGRMDFFFNDLNSIIEGEKSDRIDNIFKDYYELETSTVIYNIITGIKLIGDKLKEVDVGFRKLISKFIRDGLKSISSPDKFSNYINAIYFIVLYFSKTKYNIGDSPDYITNSVVYCHNDTAKFIKLFMDYIPGVNKTVSSSDINCVSMEKFKYPLFGLAFE